MVGEQQIIERINRLRGLSIYRNLSRQIVDLWNDAVRLRNSTLFSTEGSIESRIRNILNEIDSIQNRIQNLERIMLAANLFNQPVDVIDLSRASKHPDFKFQIGTTLDTILGAVRSVLNEIKNILSLKRRKYQQALIVLTSDYDPIKGDKRNLEIHISIPVNTRLIKRLVESIKDEHSPLVKSIRQAVSDGLWRINYDIPPLSELRIGIDISDTIIDEKSAQVLGSDARLYDWDYDKLRAESSLPNYADSLEDVISISQHLMMGLTAIRGRKGKRKKEEVTKVAKLTIFDRLPEELKGAKITLKEFMRGE